ncbi:IclR family transcriptional regulator [Nocardia sp. CA-128927]|uniref:IclR family transcriptional regulator n=1 Tax=Nocardia sp. CA-128927 TaxID=3239975 RepID=UPI003D98F35B
MQEKLTSVDKVLLVLKALGDSSYPLQLREVVELVHLAKSTTHRLLAALVRYDLVVRVGERYLLGDGVIDWAVTMSRDDLSLRSTVLPHLIDLHNSTQSVVFLGVLGDGGVHYVSSLFGHTVIKTPSRQRDWAPAHCTAVGKVLLSGLRRRPDALPTYPFIEVASAGARSALAAELRTIRRTGFAYNREQYAPGVACVAVALPDTDSGIHAAIGVCDRADRLRPLEVLGNLRRTALISAIAMHPGVPNRE